MKQGATLARGGREVTFADGAKVTLLYDLNAHYWLEQRLEKSLMEITTDLQESYRTSDMLAIICAGLMHTESEITEDEVRGRGYVLDLKARLAIGVALSNAHVTDEELEKYVDAIQKGAVAQELQKWLEDKKDGRPTGSGGGSTGKTLPFTVADSTPKNSGGSPSEN